MGRAALDRTADMGSSQEHAPHHREISSFMALSIPLIDPHKTLLNKSYETFKFARIYIIDPIRFQLWERISEFGQNPTEEIKDRLIAWRILSESHFPIPSHINQSFSPNIFSLANSQILLCMICGDWWPNSWNVIDDRWSVWVKINLKSWWMIWQSLI